MRTSLTWVEFDTLCTDLAAQLRTAGSYDMIVGVARGGLPVAVRLAHLLGVRAFGVIIAQRSNSNAAFDLSDTACASELISDPGTPRSILIVDDIMGSGRSATMVGSRVSARYGGDVDCTYAALIADSDGISNGEFSAILGRLIYARDIDNTKVWVDFPWEAGS